LTDPDAVLFALYYHDAVYNVLQKDNEEKSAQLAEKRLKALQVPDVKIETCRRHILATKVHSFSEHPDTNFFTDADLSILGQPWAVYERYTRQVRKEYAIYPDLLYKPGRRKVLEHFLQMPKIFKTEAFLIKFEQQARLNLTRELSAL
jgi:predicted metal-dependent HD superfamily phosphohydrolase